MPFSSDIIFLDPNQIQINRENRQRREINVEDIIDSIRENGIINPIIIQDNTNDIKIIRKKCEAQQSYCEFPKCDGCGFNNLNLFTLVAGERRLEAAKQLGLEIVPCRFYHTLDSISLEIIELEENLKRKDLPWRDLVQAVGKIHDTYTSQNKDWTISQSSKTLSLSENKLNEILNIYRNFNLPILKHAENLSQATNLLSRFKKTKEEVISKEIKTLIASKPLPPYLQPPKKELNTSDIDFDPLPKDTSPILNLNFSDWIKTYSGPKFNFIHCDFPQSEDNFFSCLNDFTLNIKNLIEDKTHILIWLKMNYYEEVKEDFNSNGFDVLFNPLIWFKSGTKQTQIFGDAPKETYETALIINYKNKPFLKQINNSYISPNVSLPICPNQKPLPMLKYFFQTFINNSTNFLDPTCGSGNALIAAEELGAKSILGLEIDPKRCEKANLQILRAREIRKLTER